MYVNILINFFNNLQIKYVQIKKNKAFFLRCYLFIIYYFTLFSSLVATHKNPEGTCVQNMYVTRAYPLLVFLQIRVLRYKILIL